MVGVFDELNKAMKKVEDEVRKADLDRHFNEPEKDLNKSGREVQTTIQPPGTPASPAAPVQQKTAHPGYAKITAWVKQKFKAKIAKKGDPYQSTLELEMMLNDEACKDLPSKTKKGFLAYLKNQKYEDLFR